VQQNVINQNYQKLQHFNN